MGRHSGPISYLFYCSFSRPRRPYRRAALQLGEAPSRLYIFGRLGSRAPRGPGRPGPPARQAVTQARSDATVIIRLLPDRGDGQMSDYHHHHHRTQRHHNTSSRRRASWHPAVMPAVRAGAGQGRCGLPGPCHCPGRRSVTDRCQRRAGHRKPGRRGHGRYGHAEPESDSESLATGNATPGSLLSPSHALARLPVTNHDHRTGTGPGPGKPSSVSLALVTVVGHRPPRRGCHWATPSQGRPGRPVRPAHCDRRLPAGGQAGSRSPGAQLRLPAVARLTTTIMMARQSRRTGHSDSDPILE